MYLFPSKYVYMYVCMYRFPWPPQVWGRHQRGRILWRKGAAAHTLVVSIGYQRTRGRTSCWLWMGIHFIFIRIHFGYSFCEDMRHAATKWRKKSVFQWATSLAEPTQKGDSSIRIEASSKYSEYGWHQTSENLYKKWLFVHVLYICILLSIPWTSLFFGEVLDHIPWKLPGTPLWRTWERPSFLSRAISLWESNHQNHSLRTGHHRPMYSVDMGFFRLLFTCHTFGKNWKFLFAEYQRSTMFGSHGMCIHLINQTLHHTLLPWHCTLHVSLQENVTPEDCLLLGFMVFSV